MRKNPPPLIKIRIAERVLPSKPASMKVKQGSGRACDGCDRLIQRDEPEITLSWRSELRQHSARLHRECYSYWQRAIS